MAGGNKSLIERLMRGESVECEECHAGIFLPFNTTPDKAHCFYCSNEKCNCRYNLDPVIDIE